MINKIQLFSEKFKMFPKGSDVVCGLSGGADSVCLLICLSELSETFDISVEALHVNHCLRGEESVRDELFCRDLCRKLGIKFTAVSCDVKSYAQQNSLSTEEAARILRYQAFADIGKDKIIATAHNANDNLETMLFNLTRGSALKGIAGIPPVRDNIVRPLLTVTRSEIESFLEERKIKFVTDSSNLSDDYSRNKIRHNVIPILSKINESLIETAVKSADTLRSEDSFIDAETDKVYSLCHVNNALVGISNYDEVLRRRCIARLLVESSLPYSYDRLTAADNIAQFGGKINVSGELYLVSDGNKLEIEKIPEKKPNIITSAELSIGENKIYSDKLLIAEIVTGITLEKNEIINKKNNIYFIDKDKVFGTLTVRCRKFGDKIKLFGRNITSSVKKVINETIPPEERGELHFIEDESGTIFGEKIGIADRVAPDVNTVNFLKITVR